MCAARWLARQWWRPRAELYKARGDFERAFADYDQILQIDPTDHRAIRLRGVADFEAGLLPKSLDELNRSNALDPTNPYSVLWLDPRQKSRLISQAASGLNRT